MTTANELRNGAGWPVLRAVRRSAVNTGGAFRRLLRPACVDHRIWQLTVRQFTLAAAVGFAVILFTMFFIDAAAIRAMPQQPHSVRWFFEEATDFGKSGWLLWPLGLLFLALAALPRGRLTGMSQAVLASVMVRVGFLFLAIGVPGLFVTTIKRVIGRARPMVMEQPEPFLFLPFNWTAAYAGLPSGHATTAFSALVAFGSLFPRARAVLWLYALLIVASRVAVTAHYPSDVLAGAVTGTFGALLVRRYFALRHLGFSIGPEGLPHRYPGPSPRRIKAVARALLS